jgi:predicted porin
MMQKKLIVVALTAAFALPVQAMADNGNFTFYGKADLSYDSINTGDGTTTANGATAVTGTSKRVVSSNVSKFGFKGSEDLGDGLSAIWQIEQQINIDDSSNSCAAVTGATATTTGVPACSSNNGIFATRNTFVGLKDQTLGTVLFGKHDTPYKLSTRKLDVFGDSIADNRALLGNKSNNGGFELRPGNVLAYISPAFVGISAALAHVNLKESNKVSTDKNDSATSLAVMYDVAPFYGSVAYEVHALESKAVGAEESATRLGFGFRPEGFELGVVYEKTSDNLGTAQGNKLGHTAYYVSGKMMLGNDAVKLAYGKAGVLGSGVDEIANSDASQVSVGYDHGYSKNTKVYVIYTRISNGKGIDYGFSQSTAASSSNSGFGTSPSVVSLGVQHSF